MNIIVIGAGGVGSFYGVKLLMQNHNVKFVARGKNLQYLKNNKLKLTHPTFEFEDFIDVMDMNDLKNIDANSIDAVFLATKSMQTEDISKKLKNWSKNCTNLPYFISLQNGVENEKIMAKYLDEDYVIGAITRLIAVHIIKLGLVESVGEVQTVIGAIKENTKSNEFLEKLKIELDNANTTTIITSNILKELWKKLIINNGVNASCALLEEKSGTLIKDKKLSKIVYGLMSEAGLASRIDNVGIFQDDVDEMFELMKNFESIVPSMWVDVQNNRNLELEEICGIVIKNCERQDIDASYTRTISTVLEFLYNKKRKN